MSITAEQLRAYVERIERLNEELAALKADVKEVKAEAKANGFAVGVINEIIKRRAMDSADLEEFEALLDLYKGALGMLGDTPLGEAARRRASQPEPGEQTDIEDAIASADDPAAPNAQSAPRRKKLKRPGLKAVLPPQPARAC